MEKFVKFEIHDYMDMYPRFTVITFKGNNLDEIRANAISYANHMNENYSGGTTKFVKVMSADEARKHVDGQIAAITNPDAADKLWFEEMNNLYNKCYSNSI